ncbi:hypothetical protein VNO80_06050 [Phaseolus coccineus]|uniref:Uncharacterized protein n=1 Tax=Phaseolus coccineus TaxID=3886 RepID=A0AAN9RNJ5_PHACN
MIQKNGSIHKDNCYNQIPRKYQSLGVNSKTLQDMKHRSKNYPHLINFMQGVEDVKTQSTMPYASSSSNNINIHASRTTITRYDQVLPSDKVGYHNIDLLSSSSQIDPIQNFMQDVKTQSMAPYGSSFNITTNASLMAATAYGKMWPLAFPSGQIGYSKIDLLSLPSHSNKSFSFNDVGFQGQISGFPSHPHQRSNPLMFNYLNPHRVGTNNFHGMKDIAKPTFVPPIEVQHLELLSLKDLTLRRAMKRPLCDIDIIASASKRSRVSFDSTDHEENQLQELLLFKDEDHPLSSFKIKTHAKEKEDMKKLDLSLCI